jgi:uncharacterized protein
MKIADIVSKYAAWIIRRRIPVLIAMTLAVVFMSAFAGRVTFDTNYRIWFEEDDPYLVKYDKFIREFGNDDTFVVAFEDRQGILRPPAIASLQRLTDKLWQMRGVIRVDSLTNFQATSAVADGISVSDLFPAEKPVNAELLRSASDYIAKEPLIVGSLISANKQVAVIRGKFAPNAANVQSPAEVYGQLKTILDQETKLSGYTFHIAGGPITDEAFDQVAQSDMGRLMPILLLVMIAILGVMFFSVWAVIIPLGVGAATIMVTMGVNGLLDFKLNAVTASSPQLLLGLTVATVMHLLSTFLDAKGRDMSSPDAARYALEDNLVPIVLTNVATALGFASFMVGNVVPVSRLGFVACVGSVVLTLLALTVVPALLSFYPKRARRSLSVRLDLSSVFQRLGRFAVANFKKVIMVWVGVTVLFAIFTPQLVVDSNPMLYFKPGYWFRDSIDFMEKRGSGGAVYEIVVRGSGPDSIKTVQYMRDLDKLTRYLSKEAPGDFRNVYSLSTIVRNINRSMHGDDPAYHVIPNDASEIAQYLLLYTLSVPVGQDINDRMNVTSSASRITVVRPLVSTRTSRENIDKISAWAGKNLTHAKIEFTGRDVLYTNMGNNITESLIGSLGFDVLVIIPLLLLMFRSVTASVVSVFANVGPLIIVLGLMGAFGIMLDVGTLMVAALGLGIAVDDTVHLLSHYFKYRRQGKRADDAAIGTMAHIGTPAAATTLTLMCSFLVFLAADFQPNFYFGILISVVVALALLADLTLTPALLYWMDRNRKVRGTGPDLAPPHASAHAPGKVAAPLAQGQS